MLWRRVAILLLLFAIFLVHPQSISNNTLHNNSTLQPGEAQVPPITKRLVKLATDEDDVPTTKESTPSENNSGSSVNIGMIIGIAAGAGVAIIIIAAILVRARRKSSDYSSPYRGLESGATLFPGTTIMPTRDTYASASANVAQPPPAVVSMSEKPTLPETRSWFSSWLPVGLFGMNHQEESSISSDSCSEQGSQESEQVSEARHSAQFSSSSAHNATEVPIHTSKQVLDANETPEERTRRLIRERERVLEQRRLLKDNLGQASKEDRLLEWQARIRLAAPDDVGVPEPAHFQGPRPEGPVWRQSLMDKANGANPTVPASSHESEGLGLARRATESAAAVVSLLGGVASTFFGAKETLTENTSTSSPPPVPQTSQPPVAHPISTTKNPVADMSTSTQQPPSPSKSANSRGAGRMRSPSTHNGIRPRFGTGGMAYDASRSPRTSFQSPVLDFEDDHPESETEQPTESNVVESTSEMLKSMDTVEADESNVKTCTATSEDALHRLDNKADESNRVMQMSAASTSATSLASIASNASHGVDIKEKLKDALNMVASAAGLDSTDANKVEETLARIDPTLASDEKSSGVSRAPMTPEMTEKLLAEAKRLKASNRKKAEALAAAKAAAAKRSSMDAKSVEKQLNILATNGSMDASNESLPKMPVHSAESVPQLPEIFKSTPEKFDTVPTKNSADARTEEPSSVSSFISALAALSFGPSEEAAQQKDEGVVEQPDTVTSLDAFKEVTHHSSSAPKQSEAASSEKKRKKKKRPSMITQEKSPSPNAAVTTQSNDGHVSVTLSSEYMVPPSRDSQPNAGVNLPQHQMEGMERNSLDVVMDQRKMSLDEFDFGPTPQFKDDLFSTASLLSALTSTADANAHDIVRSPSPPVDEELSIPTRYSTSLQQSTNSTVCAVEKAEAVNDNTAPSTEVAQVPVMLVSSPSLRRVQEINPDDYLSIPGPPKRKKKSNTANAKKQVSKRSSNADIVKHETPIVPSHAPAKQDVTIVEVRRHPISIIPSSSQASPMTFTRQPLPVVVEEIVPGSQPPILSPSIPLNDKTPIRPPSIINEPYAAPVRTQKPKRGPPEPPPRPLTETEILALSRTENGERKLFWQPGSETEAEEIRIRNRANKRNSRRLPFL